jgi:hypothetical protein
VLLIAGLSCAGCSQANQPETSTALQLDGRQWVAVQKSALRRSGADYIKEYLPPGQTVTDWKEILTVQEFSTAMAKRPITARDFEGAFLNDLKKDNAHVDSNLLSESDHDLLFTWKAASDTKLGNEEGLVRVSERPQGIGVIQYTSRDPMADEQLKKWQDILAHTDADSIAR